MRRFVLKTLGSFVVLLHLGLLSFYFKFLRHCRISQLTLWSSVPHSGWDFLTQTRVESGGEIPGAFWHIYQARDADRIRDFLNKVFIFILRGGKVWCM